MTGTEVSGPKHALPTPDITASPIDWAAAVKYGQKAAPSGPNLSLAEAREVVEDLRRFSREAELAVRQVTGLGLGQPVLDAVVVDRPGWIAATAEGMSILAEPMVSKLSSKTGDISSFKATQRASAVPLGMILGYLSGKVLGQFDPFTDGPGPDGPYSTAPGQLLLVAPNIVKVEREIHADPAHFRLWVCVHESTHRLQFTAVPWLQEYFKGLIAELAEAADVDQRELFDRLLKALRSRGDRPSWVELTQNPEQRVVFDKLMALMTLLEGHADHVMDAVGPEVIPSVEQIRISFSERRKRGKSLWDRLIRGLLGMEMKMKQYVQGAAFVDAVVAEVGMEAFNLVWAGPENLPTRAEVTDPGAWVQRVVRSGPPALTV